MFYRSCIKLPKVRKKRPYRESVKPQTKPSSVVCAYCSKTIAPQDQQINTKDGVMHYKCAVEIAFKRLDAIELPRPTVFSLSRDFQNYLTKQAEIFLWQPLEDAEYKLTEVLDISEEIFDAPIQLSKLIDRQSQGVSP